MTVGYGRSPTSNRNELDDCRDTSDRNSKMLSTDQTRMKCEVQVHPESCQDSLDVTPPAIIELSFS